MHYIKVNSKTHIIYNSLPRKKVNFEFVYTHGGSFIEKSQDRGKKHLLEHCIVSRTKTKDFEQFKNYTFSQNIDFNAYTGAQTMGITASGHHSDFQIIADLVLEMAFKPTFDQTILDKEKEIVLREISQRTGAPEYKLHYKVTRQVFSPESVINHEVLGDKDKVSGTTLEDFKNLHQQNLDESNFVLMVSGGSIDYLYLSNQLKKYSKGHGKNAPVIDYQYPNKFKEEAVQIVVDDLAHEQVEINLYIPAPVNYQNRATRSVFDYLFLKYGGILYDRLRDELGLIYGMNSTFDNELNMLAIYITSEKQSVIKILNEIQKTFQNFNQFFKENKFHELKNLIYKKQDIAQDDMDTTNQFIFNGLTLYNQVQDYNQFISNINLVSVQMLKELYESIGNNWNQSKLILVTNDSSLKDQKSQIQKIIQVL